jgi:hypothetical protein
LSQSIRRFTSAITSGPMPSPGRSSSLWVVMGRYLNNVVFSSLPGLTRQSSFFEDDGCPGRARA